MGDSSSNAAAGPSHRDVDEEGERGHGGDGPAQGGLGEGRGDHGEHAGEGTGDVRDSQQEVCGVGDGPKGNENFREIIKDGEKMFACNVCLDEFDQPRKVKSHISMKHLKNEHSKKRKSDDDVEKNEVKKHKTQAVFSESILEEFEKTGLFTSTQVSAEDTAPGVAAAFSDESMLEQTIVRAPPESIDDAFSIIKELDLKVSKMEDELKVARQELSDKDNIISVKEDALQILKGTLNSVEDEYKKSVARIARLEKALANMKTEIDFLRGAKGAGDKVKRLEKDLKEAESRAVANLKKVEELVVAKATLEAELVRMKKVCDLQMESLDKSKKEGVTKDVIMKHRQEEAKKIDVKCKQFESGAGCSFGDVCKFLHPVVACEYFSKVGKCPINDCKDLHKKMFINRENSGDCYFWTNGSCRFNEADCNKGRHINEKFGVNRRQDSFLGQGPGLGERTNAKSQQVLVGPQPIMLGPQHTIGGLQPALGGQQQLVSTTVGGMGARPIMGAQHQVLDNQYLNMENQQQRLGGGFQQVYLVGQQQVNGGHVGGFQPALVSGQQIPGSRETGQPGLLRVNVGAQEDSMNMSNTSNTIMNRDWQGSLRMGGR